MKITSSFKQFIDLSLDGEFGIAPISSVGLSSQSKAASKSALGIQGETPDFDRFLDTVEIEHAQAVKTELDIDIKSAFCTFSSAIVKRSLEANLVAPFTPLVYDDFDKIATVLKAPTTVKVVPTDVLGFSIGGVATVRNMLGHCYVCIEKIVETTTNEFCDYELQLYGFFKIKSETDCANILDDLSIFDLSFDVDFVTPFDVNSPDFTANRTLANEAESGVPINLKLKNWDGSQPLTVTLLLLAGDQSAIDTRNGVLYSYYNNSATNASQYASIVQITIPIGVTDVFNGFLPVLADDSYTGDTKLIALIQSVETASSETIFQLDEADINTYKADTFLILDNDGVPVVNIGSFESLIDNGTCTQIPVTITKNPSEGIDSIVRVLLDNGGNSDIFINGSNQLIFKAGDTLTKSVTVCSANNNEQQGTYSLTLEEVQNVTSGNNATAQVITAGENVDIELNEIEYITSTNRMLNISFQRSGGAGELLITMVGQITTAEVGTDFVYIDANGNETNTIPQITIPSGDTDYNEPFIKFLNETVAEDIVLSYTIDEVEDVDNDAVIQIGSRDTVTYTQLFYQRNLNLTEAAINGADEIILTVALDNSINEMIADSFKAVTDASSEIAAENTENTLTIDRNVNGAMLIGFRIPDGERFFDQTFRFTLEKIGDVLLFNEATIYEVVVPANAVLAQPDADFSVTRNVYNDFTLDGASSSSANGNITNYNWVIKDENDNVIATPTGSLIVRSLGESSNVAHTATLTVTDELNQTSSVTKTLQAVAYERDAELNDALMATNTNQNSLSFYFDISNPEALGNKVDYIKASLGIHSGQEGTDYMLNGFAGSIAGSPDRYRIGADLYFKVNRANATAEHLDVVTVLSSEGRTADKNIRFIFLDNGVVNWIDDATYLFTIPAYTNQSPNAEFNITRSNSDNRIFNFDGSPSTDPESDPLTYAWNFNDGNTALPSASPTANNQYAPSGFSYTPVLTVNDGNGNSDSLAKNFNIPFLALSAASAIIDNRPSTNNRYGDNSRVFRLSAVLTPASGFPDNSTAGAIDVYKFRVRGIAGANDPAPYFDAVLPFPVNLEYPDGADYRITGADGQSPVFASSEANAVTNATANPGRVYYTGEGTDIFVYMGIANDGPIATSTQSVFFIEFNQDQLNGDSRFIVDSLGSTNFYAAPGAFNATFTHVQA